MGWVGRRVTILLELELKDWQEPESCLSMQRLSPQRCLTCGLRQGGQSLVPVVLGAGRPPGG